LHVIKMLKEQEAQWACIAHLFFAIYIALSINDQRMLFTRQILMHSDQWIMEKRCL